MWNRRIALFFIIASSVQLLIYTGLLIQGYFNYKPAFEFMRYSFGAVAFAGLLALIIAFYMSTFVSTQRKLLGYASALIGTVLMLLSFRLPYINQLGLEWWEYFSMVAFTTGMITGAFSRLVGAERRKLSVILAFIACLLSFAAFIIYAVFAGA